MSKKCPRCEVIHWEDRSYCWRCQTERLHESETKDYREHVKQLAKESNKESAI